MAATVVANCQTDMTLFILILNLFLTLKLTLKVNQNSKYLKSYRDFTSFSETQAKETCEKGFETMKNENFKIPSHRFVKQTIPIWLISKWTQNPKLARRFSFLNRGVSPRKASM